VMYWNTPCGPWGQTAIFSLKNNLVYIMTVETAGVYEDVESAVNKLLLTMEFIPETKAIPTATPTSVNPEGRFCGGFAGIVCPAGYRCQMEGSYPDASGQCVKE